MKPRYNYQAAQRLQDEVDLDVPKTIDELCSLPGVGPKTAFLCLHAVWVCRVSHLLNPPVILRALMTIWD